MTLEEGSVRVLWLWSVTFQLSVTNVHSIRAVPSFLCARLPFTHCLIICSRSRSSVVGTETTLIRWMIRGSSPGRGKISQNRPDRLWDPLGLLLNGYWISSGLKRLGLKLNLPICVINHWSLSPSWRGLHFLPQFAVYAVYFLLFFLPILASDRAFCSKNHIVVRPLTSQERLKKVKRRVGAGTGYNPTLSVFQCYKDCFLMSLPRPFKQ